MPRQLVTVARFVGLPEAELARIILAEAGIHGFLEGEATLGWFWHWSNAVGGVKLQVAEHEASLAQAVLAERRSAALGEPEKPSGVCARCGAEIEPDFDTCWSCEAELTGGGMVIRPSTGGEPSSQQAEADAAAMGEAGDSINRAWRAAIFGMFVLPPLLSLYSLSILLGVGWRNPPLSAAANRKFYLALAMNIAVCMAAGLLVSALLRL